MVSLLHKDVSSDWIHCNLQTQNTQRKTEEGGGLRAFTRYHSPTNRFRMEKGQHCLAVNFPVKKIMNMGDAVYYVVAAMPQKEKKKHQCTSSDAIHKHPNILDKINDAIKKAKWTGYAFVFTKVFDWPKGAKSKIPIDDIKETFNNLAKTQIGQNIFRCYFSHKGPSCIKCFNNGVLSDECVHN
ncbi:hypothetical protein ABVT39_027594 [Epinephelus coioides]